MKPQRAEEDAMTVPAMASKHVIKVLRVHCHRNVVSWLFPYILIIIETLN